jgi:predicted HAD superfamily Cof-like phosphohydrolase
MTNRLSNFQMVKQFNQVFGHPAPNNHRLNIFSESPKVVNLRNSLINEEITELKEAIESEDVVEMIDALSDIQYVAYGLLVVYGIDGDVEFTNYMDEKYDILDSSRTSEIASRSNFNQTKQFIYSLLNGSAFDVSPSSFLDKYTEPSYREIFNRYVEDLMNAYKGLENATNNRSFIQTVMNTLDVLYLTYVIGSLMGVNLDTSIRMVHESNMSKICSTEEEAQKTVEWYRDNESRYDSPTYRNSLFSDGYVIFNESTGKILKNINYHAVDLKCFLE